MDIFDEFAECQEELNWIQSNCSASYFSREVLKKALGLTDAQLNSLAKNSRNNSIEVQSKKRIWVATRRPGGKTFIAANPNYEKCVVEALSKGVKNPCLMLLPVVNDKKK